MGATCVQQRVKITLLSKISLTTVHRTQGIFALFLFFTANLLVTAPIWDMRIFVSLASWVHRNGLNPNFTRVLSQLIVLSIASSSEQHYRWKRASLLPMSMHMYGSGDVTLCTKVSSWVRPVELVTALLSSGRSECHRVNQCKYKQTTSALKKWCIHRNGDITASEQSSEIAFLEIK